MDKKRLEELRKHFRAVLIGKHNRNKLWLTVSKDVLSLIDAALTEPTDEDVQNPLEQLRAEAAHIREYGKESALWPAPSEDAQQAINSISSLREYFMPDSANVEPEHEGEYQAINGALTRIENILNRQAKLAQTEDVQRAIETIESNWPPENYTMLREALTLAIRALRQMQPTGETSDGYHTFNELYHHRAILFAALSKAYPDKAWKSLKHHDGTMFGDDWFICGFETPKGQYTYHYNTTYWPLFAGKVLDNAPEWDGHKPEDVERLMSLQGYQKPTDEAVREAIEWAAQEEKSAIEDQHFSKAYHLDVIQTALRQMRTEPCEWCDGNTHKWLSVSPHAIGFEIYPDNYHKHCPYCGRPLKGGE